MNNYKKKQRASFRAASRKHAYHRKEVNRLIEEAKRVNPISGNINIEYTAINRNGRVTFKHKSTI